MADLRVAFCCSHAPALVNSDRGASPQWERVNSAFDRLTERVAHAKPDFLIVIYDDHLDNFFLNAFPTFALGAADSYGIADEGIGGYHDAPVPGAPDLSRRLADGLVSEGFDLTVCYGDMMLDHGAAIPVPRVAGADLPPIIPLAVNCVWPPMPSAKRCWILGQAIRREIASWSTDISFGVIGTGGLSHQLDGKNFGEIIEDFDREMLALFAGPKRSASRALSASDLKRGGDGAMELLNWTVVAGIVGDDPEGVILSYEPVTSAVTGMGVLAFNV